MTNYLFKYEPLYVARAETPVFDERFIGFGMTRNTQVWDDKEHTGGLSQLALERYWPKSGPIMEPTVLKYFLGQKTNTNQYESKTTFKQAGSMIYNT